MTNPNHHPKDHSTHCSNPQDTAVQTQVTFTGPIQVLLDQENDTTIYSNMNELPFVTSPNAHSMDSTIHSQYSKFVQSTTIMPTTSSSYSFPIPSKTSSYLKTRTEAATFILEVFDHYGEERDLVFVALNYMDRYISSFLQKYEESHTICPVANSSSLKRKQNKNASFLLEENHNPEKKTSSKESNHVLVSNEKVGTVTVSNENHDMVLSLDLLALVSIDLAIQLYSPTSGSFTRGYLFRSPPEEINRTHDANNARNSMVAGVSSVSTSSSSTYSLPSPEQVNLARHIYMTRGFRSLLDISNGIFSMETLAKAQTNVVLTLDFFLYPPTPGAYMKIVTPMLWEYISSSSLSYEDDSEKTKNTDDDSTIGLLDILHYSIELSSLQPNLAHCKPSLIVAAALLLAQDQEWIDLSRGELALIFPMLVGSTMENDDSCPVLAIKQMLVDLWNIHYHKVSLSSSSSESDHRRRQNHVDPSQDNKEHTPYPYSHFTTENQDYQCVGKDSPDTVAVNLSRCNDGCQHESSCGHVGIQSDDDGQDSNRKRRYCGIVDKEAVHNYY